MAALPPNPAQGYAKMGASVLGGAVSVILIYILNRVLPPPPLPDYVGGALQTIIVSLSVWFTPHSIGTDKGA